MSKHTTQIRIHRFGDLVAFDGDKGDTQYLTPETAKELAGLLLTYAADCQSVKFSKSFLDTTSTGTEPPPIDSRGGKQRFIEDLGTSVLSQILGSLGRVPDEWDGHELRQWLADKFSNEASDMPRPRMRDYENAAIVHNL